MQTILGAGGAIGNDLAKALKQYTNNIRIVSRTPKKVNENDEIVAADLTDSAVTSAAVKGSEVVYLVAGLQYKVKVWQQLWPKIMQNVIDACIQHNAKLVFFDNVYLYDKDEMHNMTEETPVNPPSIKGKVRAQIAQLLIDAIQSGSLTGMIVRSADFYGPGIGSSALQEMVYKNLKKGKKAMWLADVSKIHSHTYTPDAALATALLANTPDAYNQVWHLPTASEKLTGKEWIELFAKELNVKPRFTTLSPLMVRLVGLFNPVVKEIYELLYQNDRDYYFNSEKYRKRFPGFKITSPQEGVRAVVQHDAS
jgi:nucleoside-diphosphate-sugar epimerase